MGFQFRRPKSRAGPNRWDIYRWEAVTPITLAIRHRSSRARVSAGGGATGCYCCCDRRAARVQYRRGELEVRWWRATTPAAAVAATAKGSSAQATSSQECKRQRLLLLLRRPCPSPSQKARFFKLFSFFLYSLRIGLLDVNGSE